MATNHIKSGRKGIKHKYKNGFINETANRLKGDKTTLPCFCKITFKKGPNKALPHMLLKKLHNWSLNLILSFTKQLMLDVYKKVKTRSFNILFVSFDFLTSNIRESLLN